MKEELSLREIINEVILFFIKFRILIISITIFGTLSVVVFQELKPTYYSTTAIATSGISIFERLEGVNMMHQRTAINLINSLQSDIQKDDYEVLASKLNIEIKEASLIKGINAEQIFHISADNNKYETPKFKIQLYVKDPSIIMLVHSGLLSYFNENPYIANCYSNFKETNSLEISTIDNEIMTLRTLRLNQNSKIDMSSFNIYSETNINEIQNQIVELTQMRSVNSTLQLLLKPLSFVQDFSKSQVSGKVVLLPTLIACVISFLIAILIAIFVNVNQIFNKN